MREIASDAAPQSMQLTFSTPSLREICEKEKTADRALGIGAASQLRRRLADILAADSLEDLLSLQDDVKTTDGSRFEASLGEEAILEFSVPRTSKKPGALEPSKVHQIKVTGIRR